MLSYFEENFSKFQTFSKLCVLIKHQEWENFVNYSKICLLYSQAPSEFGPFNVGIGTGPTYAEIGTGSTYAYDSFSGYFSRLCTRPVCPAH